MSDRLCVRRRRQLLLSIAAASLLVIGFLVGYVSVNLGRPLALTLTEIPVQATGSVRSDTIAAATGPIDDKIEGLFTLDFLTGQLQCAVLYTYGPGAKEFGAIYQANVAADMGLEQTRKPSYLLLTGLADFSRGSGSGANRPGASVVYVVDANTGNFASYGVPWNPAKVSRGTAQGGALIPLASGTARMSAVRE